MGKEGEEEGGSKEGSVHKRAQAHCCSSRCGGENPAPFMSAFSGEKAHLPPQVSGQTHRGTSHSIVENLINSRGSELV